jgi:ribose transport system substrate-binding protein
MKRLSKLSPLAVVSALVALLAVTAASAAPNATILIGESSPIASNPNQQAITYGQRLAAKKYGFSFKTLDANLSADKQVSDIDTFISLGAKGLTSWTLDPGAADAAYSRAAAKGAAIVGFNSASKYISTTIGQQTDYGTSCGPFKDAAKYIAQRAPKAKVFVIGGPPVPSITMRVTCFTKAAKAAGLTVVAKQDNVKDTAATAQPIVQDMYTKHPDVQAIWAYNDPSALGAAAVVQSSGKSAWNQGSKSGVIVIGNNGSQEAIDAIKAGKMTVTYDANSPQAGAMAVYALALKLKLNKKMPKAITIKSTRYDASNAKSYVTPMKRKVTLPPLK